MKLRAADDGHNVYVLYSDLLFNLLILFLIIVLALVLRMHGTMQAVRAAAEPTTRATGDPDQDRRLIASMERAHLDDLEKIDTARGGQEAAERRAIDVAERDRDNQRTIQSQKQALAAAVAEVEAAKRQTATEHDTAATAVSRQVAIAAGANRFSGRSGSTSMCVAMDLSGSEPKYVLVSASAFSSALSTLDGEPDDRHKVRSAGVLHDAIDDAPRFSEDDLTGIFKALDVSPYQTGSGGGEGQLYFSYAGQASMVASGWEDREGNVTSIPARIQSKMNDGSYGRYHGQLINNLIKLRDALHPARVPQSVPVLHFSATDDQSVITAGDRQYRTADFRQIVSSFGQGGIILQYDAVNGELCPEWVIRDVLTRTGYTNAVPDPAELKRLREKLQRQD